MSSPSPSWNTNRVYATWHNLDGTLKAGTWSVEIPVRVTNATDDVIVPRGITRGTLQTTDPTVKSLDVGVPATNDPDNLPSNGWQVTIRISFTDGTPGEVYVIDVPVDGAAIDLRTVIPTNPAAIPAPSPTWVIGGPGGLALFGQTIVVVVHGNDPNVARPSGAPVVAWCGDAEPAHATSYDFRIPATA